MSVISYFVVYVFLKTKIFKKKCFSSNTKPLHLHVLGPIQSSVASINFLKKKHSRQGRLCWRVSMGGVPLTVDG